MSYKLAPRARRDLEDIWLYTYKTWSLTQADDYYRELLTALGALSEGTKVGRPIDGIGRGYLSLPAGSHRIIYRKSGQRVMIIRILHRRMQVARHL